MNLVAENGCNVFGIVRVNPMAYTSLQVKGYSLAFFERRAALTTVTSLTSFPTAIEGCPGVHQHRVEGQYTEGDDLQLTQETNHDLHHPFVDICPDPLTQMGEGHLRRHHVIGMLGMIQIDAYVLSNLTAQRGLIS